MRETELCNEPWSHKGALLAVCILRAPTGHSWSILYYEHGLRTCTQSPRILHPRHTPAVQPDVVTHTRSHTHHSALDCQTVPLSAQDDAFQTECQLDWYIFLAGECHFQSQQAWKYLPSAHTPGHTNTVPTLSLSQCYITSLSSLLFPAFDSLKLFLKSHKTSGKQKASSCRWMALPGLLGSLGYAV